MSGEVTLAPVPPHRPGHQPDLSHPEDATRPLTAPREAAPERVSRHAADLLDHPEGVEVLLGVHALPEGQRGCAQCRTPWPCPAWQQATLARILLAGAPPRRGRSIGWPRRRQPVFSWFDPPVSFALLPCRVDWRIHAVYDPTQLHPDAVCGVYILPDIDLPGPIIVCPRCLAAIPEHAELHPGLDHRGLLDTSDHTGPLRRCWRWWLTRCYSRSIRRAAARAVAARKRRRGG